ncbi:MAG: GNAT family N-acetyltransferase [Actinomycetota bacterium]
MITRTDRLVLRLPVPADAEAILDYMNDPVVAEMQDWDLPRTAADVAARIERINSVGWPAPGEWVNLTIEADGHCVGDVACHLDEQCAVAEVGYTLAHAHWGKGYASEALSALVDHLLASQPVHRMAASLDPQNVRSMRVLEGAGFTMEGFSRRSYPMRGRWDDDLRYAMLREDRAAWQSRPSTPPKAVELVEVTAADAAAWEAVQTHWSQRRLVQPLTRTFRDLAYPPLLDGVPSTPVLRGVIADSERVGTVLWSDTSSEQHEVYLWRLIIDRMHQRRGIGSMVLRALQHLLQLQGHRSMVVSYLQGPGSPERFYAHLGFEPTGSMRGPEVEARLRW